MAKIRSLSKSAEIELQRLMSRVLSLEQATGIGPRAPRGPTAHYLVMTPAGGIPAASGTPLIPGEAVCHLNRRTTSGGDDGILDLSRDQVVRNFETTAVAGDTLILAHRDAYGDLWATVGGGSCTDLPAPGAYKATVGATIAPGASGSILYDGEIYSVTNHSNCTFYTGDLITFVVDPDCVTHFTGCSCCGSAESPPACCDRSIAVCINGVVAIIAVNGGSHTFAVADCTDCVGATMKIDIACAGTPAVITATWLYTCGMATETGTLDWSDICDDPPIAFEDLITVTGGAITIHAGASAAACDDCALPPLLCETCSSLVWTNSVTGFSFEDTNIKSSSFAITNLTPSQGDVFTITVVLSMVASDDTETGQLRIGVGGSTILSATPDSNKAGLVAPPVITNPVSCGNAAAVRWDLLLTTGISMTMKIVSRFEGCVGTGAPIIFTWDSDRGPGWDQTVTWTNTCGDCEPEAEPL